MRLFLALLFAAALAVPQTQSPDPADAVRHVLESQAADWNRGDIPAFMNGYWQSDQTEFVGAAGVTRGWQAVRDRYLRTYKDKAAMGQLAFANLEVKILCPDTAYVLGDFALTRAQDHPHGVFTLLFRHFPEGWRIVSDHSTSEQP